MRLLLLLYTFICWVYPLSLGYGIFASGYALGAMDKVLLMATVLSIVIIPLNYYFLFRIFINPPFSARLYQATLVFLVATLFVMGYWSYDAFRAGARIWMDYLPPIGFIATVFLFVFLIGNKVKAS